MPGNIFCGETKDRNEQRKQSALHRYPGRFRKPLSSEVSQFPPKKFDEWAPMGATSYKAVKKSAMTLFGVWGTYPRTQSVRVSPCVHRTGGKSPEIFTLLLSTSLFQVCTECVILLARTCTDMDHFHIIKMRKNKDAKIHIPPSLEQ